jgi:UDP-N-acetylmuramoylalanine--D-glutamate ligase
VQRAGEIGGVIFYDDSKGTNVGSTVAALNGMTVPVVLIAGGEGKGQDFAPLAAPVRKRARAVVLIGRDAGIIEHALAQTGIPLLHAASMHEAVEKSLAQAVTGDAVLLSPACASFDMFDNYKHRGEVFAQCVAAIGARRQH